jgi:hypothetical protein
VADKTALEKIERRTERQQPRPPTATTFLWSSPNGNGNGKENGLKHGHNGNRKDHLKSGPKLSEEPGAP